MRPFLNVSTCFADRTITLSVCALPDSFACCDMRFHRIHFVWVLVSSWSSLGSSVLEATLFEGGRSCTCLSCGLSRPVLCALQAAVQAYIAEHDWAFDQDAIKALRGADDLVVESFLQVTEGHVVRWANYGPGITERSACSRATRGLVDRLEYCRQVYKDTVQFPQGLVPCVLWSLVWRARCLSYP